MILISLTTLKILLTFTNGIFITWCNYLVLSHAQPFVTPRTVAHQAPLSMEFSRQGYFPGNRNGLPFPIPGDLPNPGIEPTSLVSPALVCRFLTTESPGKPYFLFHIFFLCKFSTVSLCSFLMGKRILFFFHLYVYEMIDV